MKYFTLIVLFSVSIFAQSQPSYKIWSVVTNPTLDKGDTLTFDIGLSGNGVIDTKYLKFALYGDATSKIFIKGNKEPLEILVLHFPELISSLFKSDNPVTLPADTTRITVNQHFSIVPESSGDKTIKVIATYSSDGLVWYTEEAFINFHVNTWYEEYETFLVIIGLLFALVAIFDPISNVYLKLFKKPSQISESHNTVHKKKK